MNYSTSSWKVMMPSLKNNNSEELNIQNVGLKWGRKNVTKKKPTFLFWFATGIHFGIPTLNTDRLCIKLSA